MSNSRIHAMKLRNYLLRHKAYAVTCREVTKVLVAIDATTILKNSCSEEELLLTYLHVCLHEYYHFTTFTTDEEACEAFAETFLHKMFGVVE